MLEKIFKTKQEMGFSKEQIAKLLKTNPEALEKFEKIYQIESMNYDSDNLMEQSAIVKKSINPHLEEIGEYLNDIIERIVEELVSKTLVMKYKDGKFEQAKCISKEVELVSLEEIRALPESLRPQLTGRHVKKDADNQSSHTVLEMYDRYLKEKNPKKKEIAYGMFRQGLDILDLDGILYEMLSMNPISIENWFPELCCVIAKQSFFKIPNTTIIRVPITLLQLSRLDYETMTPTTLQIVDRYCERVFELDESKEYFIKTGVFSSKYFFRNAHVKGSQEVKELGEYLLYIQNQSCNMSGPLVSPHFYGVNTTNTWVVRDFIQDNEKNPCIYNGMPLHTEYRVFVDFDSKEVLGVNPYWDPVVMKQRFGHENDADSPHNIHDYIIYQMHEETLMKRYTSHCNDVLHEVSKLLPNISLHGQWSIDVMQNGNDFYIIDMALAEVSALNHCIPKGKLKKYQENWIPDFCEN